MEPWLAHAAEEFWSTLGTRLPYPRDLQPALPLAYPISCVPVPRLSTARVQEWLERRGAGYHVLCGDRSLSGCVLASRGQALLFTRAEDSPEERRFTVAHELAHYLLDYRAPREKALVLLGPGILEVLDGFRPPTMEERLSAALEGVNLGVYCSLLPRAADGDITAGAVLKAETRADQLALELLAPLRSVRAHLNRLTAETNDKERRDPGGRRAAAMDLLARQYGLPERMAGRYAARLVKPRFRSTAEWLGIA